MKKLIEIKVKTPLSKDQLDSFISGDINGVSVYNQLYGSDLKQFFDAKLIIEIPEKTITISESDFDAAAWGRISFNSLKSELFK